MRKSEKYYGGIKNILLRNLDRFLKHFFENLLKYSILMTIVLTQNQSDFPLKLFHEVNKIENFQSIN
jgi:hypothetical protein